MNFVKVCLTNFVHIGTILQKQIKPKFLSGSIICTQNENAKIDLCLTYNFTTPE